MGSWLIIAILIGLLLIVSIFYLLLRYDIRTMTRQLDGIIENFGTNEIVRTSTHNRSLSKFAANINKLISVFKQDQQRGVAREKNLKQEITNISHDFRTPLTSMKGFSELLSDTSLTDSEKKEYLAVVQKKIDHLIDIVDLFYELSQLNSSDQHLVIEKVDLNQTVIDVLLSFYDEFEKKQLEVHFDESEGLPILADQKAVSRIVANIIQNALTYSKSTVTIQLSEEGANIGLQVTNDFESMDVAQIERIFDRTFRMDGSRSDGQLGLGLHIVRQLIGNLGGQAVAEVDGDTFTLAVLFKKWGS
ncbi:HAMP domain-containing histidine kinase [Sporosarcina sp. Sa2YVA2]|uniref:histidine kinase n=1 Tax=Sporosarcina quadrami TaxID=2762234 RepID=A0ABR8UD55_9BACL|nr:HAMP domain-containing sensor histidine kinase [Sporosarcina quadrami]MBD7985967.1 HAMP domain-containing histidine kinase [Sporosarcina quadrami]